MMSQIVTNQKQSKKFPFLKISPKMADMMLSGINNLLYTKKFDNTIDTIVKCVKNNHFNEEYLMKKGYKK